MGTSICRRCGPKKTKKKERERERERLRETKQLALSVHHLCRGSAPSQAPRTLCWDGPRNSGERTFVLLTCVSAQVLRSTPTDSQCLLLSCVYKQPWKEKDFFSKNSFPGINLSFIGSCFFLLSFFPFLGPKVRHMEAPRLGVESEL